MAISANTLFHFTDSIESLINILTNEFVPYVCLEDLNCLFNTDSDYSDGNIAGIPMVCFCDIPLSQISNHINHYGGYAIGLTKEWGIASKLNPVMYLIRNSIITGMINRSIRGGVEARKVKHMDKDTLTSITRLSDDLIYLSCFCKPYMGQHRGEVKVFYDEKEWRYVPVEYLVQNNQKPILRKSLYEDNNILDEYKTILSGTKLSFTPKDIKYLIVKNDDEILRMKHLISEIKGDKFQWSDVELLGTKLISLQYILEDF